MSIPKGQRGSRAPLQYSVRVRDGKGKPWEILGKFQYQSDADLFGRGFMLSTVETEGRTVGVFFKNNLKATVRGGAIVYRDIPPQPLPSFAPQPLRETLPQN